MSTEVQKAGDNCMRAIRVEKLVLNISVGTSGDKLSRAEKVLNELCEQQPVLKRAKITIRKFGVRRNEKIACCVTVRGSKAVDILRKGLDVKNNELIRNFGFGISEHIEMGIKYDPNIGIYGMDFYVHLTRPGYRITQRKRCKARIAKSHRVSRSDAIEWFKQTFDGVVI